MNINKRKSQHKMSVGTYSYDELAHWWVYNYGIESTASDRMSVKHNTVYSYSTPIAKMLPPRKGSKEPVIMLSKLNDWSNTAKRHIEVVERACHHLEIIEVFALTQHSKTLEKYTYEQRELAYSYSKKRKEWTREAVLIEMQQNNLNVERLASYFKLKRSKEYKAFKKILLPTSSNFQEALDLDRRIAEASKRTLERAFKRKQVKQKKETEEKIIKAKENLPKWLNGENVSVNTSILNLYPKLRINGDMIETTNGGTLPLKIARIFFKKYQEGKLKEGQHISSYMFKGVSNDIATIGCHSIELIEIERVLNV